MILLSINIIFDKDMFTNEFYDLLRKLCDLFSRNVVIAKPDSYVSSKRYALYHHHHHGFIGSQSPAWSTQRAEPGGTATGGTAGTMPAWSTQRAEPGEGQGEPEEESHARRRRRKGATEAGYMGRRGPKSKPPCRQRGNQTTNHPGGKQPSKPEPGSHPKSGGRGPGQGTEGRARSQPS